LQTCRASEKPKKFSKLQQQRRFAAGETLNGPPNRVATRIGTPGGLGSFGEKAKRILPPFWHKPPGTACESGRQELQSWPLPQPPGDSCSCVLARRPVKQFWH